MKARTLALMTTIFSAAAGAAVAEFPEKPLEIVVPFSAGGGTDVMARIFADALSQKLGQPVVVRNVTGAGGEIGMAEVATGATDGYSMVIVNTPNVLTIPVERDARFTVDSFDLLGSIAEDPATVSVKESSPIDTIADLVAAAGDATMTYGSSGVGSAGHIAMLLLGKSAGITALNVPYDGAAAVRNGLLNGDVQLATANLGEALTFAAGADWRILGVMASDRVATQPDLPTFAEAGYPVIGGSLRGLGVAKGTDPAALEILRAAMADVMDDAEFLDASAKAQVPIRYLDPQAYEAELSRTAEAIRTLWAESPWK